ncbi:MAG: uracil-DNA glycosylase family protein [Ferroplasma sp.]
MKSEFSYGIIIYAAFPDGVKYLFLKRKEGWYDFPKGHIEAGETGQEAAIRETLEESGLTIKESSLVPFFNYTIAYQFNYHGIEIDKHVSMYMSEIDYRAEIKISHEHVGFKWLSYSESMINLRYRNQQDAIKYAESYRNKLCSMKEINSRYSKVSEMPGWELSKTFVPGEGNLNAKICILGQAPGRNEDIQKRPFIGRSGKLLDSMLAEAGIGREQAYITSIVQFYPPGNRVPDSKEISICMPFLKEQLDILKPHIIILLGNVAINSMLNIKGVMENHGKFIGNKYFITFHPAAALRNPATLDLMRADFIKLRSFKDI